MTEELGKIIFYGTEWCPDCRRSLAFFKRNNIAFEYINIDDNSSAEMVVKQINHGYRSVPTIVFQDGSFLTEPSDQALQEKLNLKAV
jgi:glutaredoxin